MTPEENNVVRSQGRKCVAEIQQALECRPKPKWNAVVPPILKKHHKIIAGLGVSLIELNSVMGRMQGRYGVES
ncbi:hypothetical protein [Citrobacter portucalensis]|uniref:hypothetical protein n=1 Tax=Citrobacter portucalensis TaxID=1639133 RepID=UPI0018A54501|nr:hypothetical protein [Citrobacter portucalensis]BBV44978.1 hypothetical protein STW0522CIT27_14180 [Citrobacter portucalensis]BBW41910.1 hypothetical protein STN0717CIT72_33660 [Citrobacter portucalensis]